MGRKFVKILKLQDKLDDIRNETKANIRLMDEYHFYDADEENRGWWTGLILDVDKARKRVRGAFGGKEEWNEVCLTCIVLH